MRKCLDSILAQTFEDYECLLIDDGSTDGSPAICDEYAQKDTRFKAFHKPNGGVSAARQFGLDHAQGEYVIHADPDDWVDSTMLEELYKKAVEENVDMVICDFYENSYKGQKYVQQRPSSCDSSKVLKEIFENLHGSCWNKLVRRECFEKYHVHFPLSINVREDLYVNASLLINSIQVSYLNKAFYHYVRDNFDSLSRRYDDNSEKQNIAMRKAFADLFKDNALYSFIDNIFSYLIVASAFWGGKNMYSSKQFLQKFSKYKDCIYTRPITLKKTLIILSINGFYHPIINIVDLYMKLKQNILSS